MLGDDIPSRIDLYKHKCGGPFTNDEEVEDVLIFIISFVVPIVRQVNMRV